MKRRGKLQTTKTLRVSTRKVVGPERHRTGEETTKQETRKGTSEGTG